MKGEGTVGKGELIAGGESSKFKAQGGGTSPEERGIGTSVGGGESSKTQASSSKKVPNAKLKNYGWCPLIQGQPPVDLETWDLGFLWSLDFGPWSFFEL